MTQRRLGPAGWAVAAAGFVALVLGGGSLAEAQAARSAFRQIVPPEPVAQIDGVLLAGTVTFEPATDFEWRIESVELKFDHGGSTPACPPPDDVKQLLSPEDTVQRGSLLAADYEVLGVAACNRTYDVLLEAVAAAYQGPNSEIRIAEVTGVSQIFELPVEIPAPPPTHVVATALSDRTVTVGWKPPEPKDGESTPGLVGYRLLRFEADGSAMQIGADLPVTAEAARDPGPPAAGGTVGYMVQALRNGATDGSVVAGVPAFVSVTVPAAPTTSAPPTTPPSTSPPAAGGTGATGGAGGGAPTGAAPTTVVPAPGGPFVVPYDRASGAGSLPAEDVPEPGSAAETTQSFTDDAGEGLLKPAAISLVVLGWALHAFYLSRRAQQVEDALAGVPLVRNW